jgi:lysophospholipase L1-like esterase
VALVVGLNCVAVLGLIELALGLFSPVRFRQPSPDFPPNVWTGLLHRRSDLPGLAYELNPGAVGTVHGAEIAVNSLGFRGREHAVIKPPDTFRIVVVGASIAFGWTVPIEQSYPERLETRLNARVSTGSKKYEVLNLGVGGYTIHDEVVTLVNKALPLDPDLVLLDYHPNGAETEPIQPLQQVFHDVEWWERWHVLRMWALARRTWGIERLGDGDEYRYLNSPAGPHWPVVAAAWDRARDACSSRGVPVVVPMFPSFGKRESWSEYPYRAMHEQVRRAVSERGFLAVDMLPVFEHCGRSIKEVAADHEHPNALGLDLIAAELERVILERHVELLKSAPPLASASTR